MKLRKTFLAVFLAFAMVTVSACSLFGEDGASVTFRLNGGTAETYSTYKPGEEKALPVPEKENYDFAGWYDNEALAGEAQTKISSTADGELTFWAKWTPKTYTIEYFNIANATLSKELIGYTYGTGEILPEATQAGYNFLGWYDNAQLDGEAVTILYSSASGNKTFYAKWEGKTYSLTLNLKGGVLDNAPTTYTYGVETVLPEPTRSQYNFSGWYEDSACTGTPVTKITANDAAENRVFYAGWEAKTALTVTAYGGCEEGMYAEFGAIAGVNTYKVSYSAAGANSYTQIDDALVRIDSSANTVRADVIGIKAGAYDLKIEAGKNDPLIKSNITVSAYDRSGYAHFGTSDGVGAYNNDGTPKSNAQIIYVSEATKNSVTAKIGNKNYTGLVAILQALPAATTPVIIRVLDTVKAATWNEKIYSSSTVTPEYIIANTPGKDGATLAKQKYTMQQLIDGGFNTLNIDPAKGGCSPLDGLYASESTSNLTSGYMNYDSSKNEFDSCWNNCPVGSSGNSPENVTLEGVGKAAGLFQWGITWKYAQSVEVRNLTFDDYNEDACSFEGNTNSTTFNGFDSNRIWLHHCTFEEGKNYWDVCNEQDKGDGDGSTDFKKCAYVTIAYNHYIDTHKTGLIGGGGSHKTANVTFHHNYYQHCKARLPLGRQANMHMYNNYYENTTDTCLSLRAGAYALVEYCYFKNAKNPIEAKTESGAGSEGSLSGAAKVFNCKFDGIALTTGTYVTNVTDRTATVANQNQFSTTFDTNASFFYYDAANKCSKVTDLITDLSKIPDAVKACAGVHKN